MYIDLSRTVTCRTYHDIQASALIQASGHTQLLVLAIIRRKPRCSQLVMTT